MRTPPLLGRWAPLVAAIAGLAATVLVVAILGMSPSMTASLAWRAALAVAASVALGAGALSIVRRKSVGVQAVVVALSSVVAVGITYGTAMSAYLTGEELHVLAVVLTGAAAVGVVTALLLGRRVLAASQALGAAARRIGEGDRPRMEAGPGTGELGALASELDRMAARLDEARSTERALETSRRELVAWVSHDLRTPLAGIRAIAEALEDGLVDDPETVSRYHYTLRREADRLADLVTDLFELSRIQAGTLLLEMERASFGDLVSDAIAAADPVAAAKGVRLRGEEIGSAPEVVLSTPQVSRVLRNLLENAIRHTPSDGSVFVSAGRDGEDAFVSVADACGGIDEDEIERVFDLAFRGEAARTPGEDNGAGLGLAIAKGIVEAHSGDISVANDGPGCRFTVRLPIGNPGAA